MDYNTKISHYYWLDTIRFVSAFIVVISHTSIVFQTNYEGLDTQYQNAYGAIAYMMLRSGAEAVMIFFVLSGFLVGGRTVEKLKNKAFSPKQYVIDRIVRIILPLFPALILSYIVNRILGIDFRWYDYVGNLLSLQDIFVKPVNGVLWSLSREVWYYIFMFSIALLTINKYKWGGGVICFISYIVFQVLGTVGFFAWCIGALYFIIKNNIVNRYATIIMVIIWVISSFYYKQTFRGVLIPSIPTPSREIIELLYAVSVGYFLVYVIDKRPKKHVYKKIHKWGEYGARFSYTLYLCHYPILLLIKEYVYKETMDEMNISTTLVILSIAVCTSFATYPIYYFSERHTKRIKEMLT